MIDLILFIIGCAAFLGISIWVIYELIFGKETLRLLSYKCTNIVDGEYMPITEYESRFIERFERKYPIYSAMYAYEYCFAYKRKGDGRLMDIDITVNIVKK